MSILVSVEAPRHRFAKYNNNWQKAAKNINNPANNLILEENSKKVI